jgi:hypothetical protein
MRIFKRQGQKLLLFPPLADVERIAQRINGYAVYSSSRMRCACDDVDATIDVRLLRGRPARAPPVDLLLCFPCEQILAVI